MTDSISAPMLKCDIKERKTYSIAFLPFCALPAIAQQPETKPVPARQDSSAEPRTFRLREQAAPDALGSDEINIPTLTWYAPWNSNGATTAVIVMPGGGYQFLATNHEGRQVGNWLNALHVTSRSPKARAILESTRYGEAS
jgi:acetyl esterase/lipase